MDALRRIQRCERRRRRRVVQNTRRLIGQFQQKYFKTVKNSSGGVSYNLFPNSHQLPGSTIRALSIYCYKCVIRNINNTQKYRYCQSHARTNACMHHNIFKWHIWSTILNVNSVSILSAQAFRSLMKACRRVLFCTCLCYICCHIRNIRFE